MHRKFSPGMPFVLVTLLINMIGFGIIIPVLPGLIQAAPVYFPGAAMLLGAALTVISCVLAHRTFRRAGRLSAAS